MILDSLLSMVRKWICGPEEKVLVHVEQPIEATGWRQFPMAPGGYRPTWIVIHHSFSADGNIRDWDGIRKYHMSYRYQGNIISQGQYDNYKKEGKTEGLELPWKDIGYNFGIEEVDGKIQVMAGRALGSIGAHAIGFNSRSIGICLIGNYDPAPPSEDRLYTVSSLCRQLQIQFGIPRDQVIGHRETYGKLTPPLPPAKTCPGKMFDMEKFRARIRA